MCWPSRYAIDNKISKRFELLLYVIDIYSKYAWLIPLKDKKGITMTNTFQKVESNHKPNKIWINKVIEFYDRSMKSWPEKMLYKLI